MRDIGNLVFIVLALLAWIIKEVVERKQAKGAPAPREEGAPSRGRLPPPETDTGEVDVVYGRRRVPEALTAPPVPPPAGGSILASTATFDESLAQAPSLSVLRAAQLGTALATAAALGGPGRRSSARAWSRLGLRSRARRRALVRSGVLWAEVLGSPRAYRGPHRHAPRRPHV